MILFNMYVQHPRAGMFSCGFVCLAVYSTLPGSQVNTSDTFLCGGAFALNPALSVIDSADQMTSPLFSSLL